MIEIPLTGKNGAGKYALISDEDYELVAMHKWFLHKQGYACRSKKGKTIRMHRVILGAQKGQLVDHQDLNRLNNQRSNLRFATWLQNLQNSAKRGTHQYKGVYFSKWSHNQGRPSCWKVTIRQNGTLLSFGMYKTAEEAARAYDIEIVRLRGEFALTNFAQ